MVFVVVVNLRDVANLATKGWSSKAAEHQHKWPTSRTFTDMKAGRAIERHQSRIRGIIPNLQLSEMHVRQRVPHHTECVFRAAGHEAQPRKYGNRQDSDCNRGPF